MSRFSLHRLMDHSLTSSSRRRPHRPQAARSRRRLSLERLEDRTLLATDFWVGSVSSNWSNPSNWSLGAVPGPADTADFNSSHSKNGTASVDTAFTISSLVIESTWGGTLYVNRPLTDKGNLTLDSGTMNVNAATTIAGSGSAWSGGTLDIGSGGLTNTGTLTVSGGPWSLAGTLTNTGTIAVTTAQTIYAIADGATINNQAGATFDFRAAAVLNSNGQSGTAFNNAGTLERSTGSGTATINFPVDGSGTIAGDSGTLALTGGGSGSKAIINAGAGGIVSLSGGFSGTFGGSGAGSVQLANFTGVGSGATLNFAGSALQWTGGTLDGTVANAGTMGVSGGPWSLAGTLTNTGTIAVTTAQTVYAIAGGATINNQGQLTLNAGAVLSLASYTQTATATLTIGVSGTSFGQIVTTSTVSLAGNLVIALSGTFVAGADEIINNGSSTPVTGTFSTVTVKPNTHSAKVQYTEGDGDDVTVTLS